jgi:hypothetical protein
MALGPPQIVQQSHFLASAVGGHKVHLEWGLSSYNPPTLSPAIIAKAGLDDQIGVDRFLTGQLCDILPNFAKSNRDVYHGALRRGALFLCLC